MQPPGIGIVFYLSVRIIWIIYILLWSIPIFGQGKIREVYVPQEVVSGDSFVVAVVATAPKAGVERMAAVNVPGQMRFARAFMSHGSFEEPVPLIEDAAAIASTADIFVIVGTSMLVYPAAGLIHCVPMHTPRYVIDRKIPDIPHPGNAVLIEKAATEGVRDLINLLRK